MSKKMLINASHPEENRVAIVVDGILSELDIEIAGQEQTKGNIYKAVVVRVESGLQAAFVDYGAEKMGFLQIGEIHPNLYPQKENLDPKSRPRINEILQRGQEILVQVVKEERGTKGAALTTFLSLPGRYMVLMPDSKTKGVSRKITDESERKQLKRTMAELDLPERMGYIVRTAGIGKEQEELKRDFDYLVSLYQGILNHKEQSKAPAQLYQESNLVIRSIRDYFSNEIDEVLIDDSRVFKEAKDFFSLVMPDQTKLVRQHRERRPIFSRFQIEEQIDGLARNQIPLPSGGSIVIDQTEALVAIDVNSGKMSSENGIEATAGKTNIEAAAEVGRQLRLRDLGGLIVIDFIDMRDRKRIRDVEHTLRVSLRDDKAKVTVGRISQFGLLEMSRQRIKGALSVGAYLDCPHCQGKGRIKSVEAQAISFLRQAHSAASKGQIARIEARTPLEVANYLLNEKRSTLGELEKQLSLTISIEGRPDFVPGQIELELHKREKQQDQDQDQEQEQEQPLRSAPVSHANKIEEALAAVNQEKPEPAIPAEEPEAKETMTPNGEENTGRKRRRRRRRRGGRKDTDDLQVTTSENSENVPSDGESIVTPTANKDVVITETENEVTKPANARPRNRRGGRKTTTEGSGETLSETGAKPIAAPEVESTDLTNEISTAGKPKRQPTQKTPVKKTVKSTEIEHQKESDETQMSSVKTVDEVKPKKRAPRKTPTKKKTSESSLEGTDTSASQPVDLGTADKEAEVKPKRRAPRKIGPAKEQTSQVEATEFKEQQENKTPDSKKPEEKPKKRTPRQTPARQDSAAVQQSIKSATEPNRTVTENPEDNTSSRRKVKQEVAINKTEETKETIHGSEVPVEKPKRGATKKASMKAEKPLVEPAIQSAIDKPKSRTVKKTRPSKQTETDSGIPETPKPKRRTPRKSAAIKTDTSPVKRKEDQTVAGNAVGKVTTEKKPRPRKKRSENAEDPSSQK